MDINFVIVLVCSYLIGSIPNGLIGKIDLACGFT